MGLLIIVAHNWNYRGGEKIAGRAAIQQAMYHELGFSVERIAAVCGVSREAVLHGLFDAGLIPWVARKHQREAIAAARALITPSSRLHPTVSRHRSSS